LLVPSRARLTPLLVVLMPVALAIACGCGRLVAPMTPGMPAREGLPSTLPDATFALPGEVLTTDVGPDLSGPEARVAVVGVFVAPPGSGAGFLDSGLGEGIAFSYRAKPGGNADGDIYLEWGLERSSHEEAGSGLPAEYWRATGGVRWSFAWGTMSEFYFSLGGGYHDMAVSGGRELEGPGAYGGAGIEFLLSRASSALVNVRFNYFWSHDPGYAVVLAAGIGLRL